MKKYMVKTGITQSGKPGYALAPTGEHQAQAQRAPDPASQPVSRQDILTLQENLIWPPKEMRDVNLVEMDTHRKAINTVWEDPNLDPTAKLLKAGYHSQMFALANKKHFSKGEPGAAYLPSSYQALPPPTPAQEWKTAHTPTDQDLKQTASLIPRFRGTPMSLETTLLNVPHHLKSQARKMSLSLKSPDSGIGWDSQGKLIDMSSGVRGRGRVLPKTNIQDLLSYATNPQQDTSPPRGYAIFRDALYASGKQNLLSPLSEELYFSSIKKEAKKSRLAKKPKAEAEFYTPLSTLKGSKFKVSTPKKAKTLLNPQKLFKIRRK